MQKGETMKKKILLMLIPLLAMTQSSYASYRMEEWEEGIEQINGMTVFDTDKASSRYWRIEVYPKDTIIHGYPIPAHIGIIYTVKNSERAMKIVIHIDENGNLQPEAMQVARGNAFEYPSDRFPLDYGGPDCMLFDMVKYKGEIYPISVLGHISYIREKYQMDQEDFFKQYTLNKCVRELINISYPAWNRFGRFIVPEENPYLKSIEGWLFSKSGKTLINAENSYDEKGESGKTNFILRLLNGELSEEWENIDTIGDMAFLYAEQGKYKETGKRASIYIDLPKHVKVIGQGAFWSSNLLRDSLTIPASVRVIKKCAFNHIAGYDRYGAIGSMAPFRVIRFLGTIPPKMIFTEAGEHHPPLPPFKCNASTTFIVPDGCKNAYREVLPADSINIVEESEYATTVKQPVHPSVKIRRNANMLIVGGCEQEEQVQVFTADGKIISNSTSSGNHDMLIFLPWEEKNIIVRVGNRKTFKIK